VYVVTGAGGQLGRALAEEFADDGIVALSRADWDVELPFPDGLGQPDVVLHAAAWTNVDGAEGDPQGAAAVNVGGTANVAALGAPLVYYSTDYVFDGSKGEPYVESDGPNPRSAYGRSKLHGEAAAGERAWIVRSSWLFGPTGTNFVRAMLRLGAKRDEVAVVDDQRGSPTYARDLAHAIELLLRRGAQGIVHATNSGQTTWYGFAREIASAMGMADASITPVTTEEFPRPAPRPRYSVLSGARFRALTGENLRPWEEAMRQYLSARPSVKPEAK
jgi:dTDP-4-dehydrorhamnose reductase